MWTASPGAAVTAYLALCLQPPVEILEVSEAEQTADWGCGHLGGTFMTSQRADCVFFFWFATSTV